MEIIEKEWFYYEEGESFKLFCCYTIPKFVLNHHSSLNGHVPDVYYLMEQGTPLSKLFLLMKVLLTTALTFKNAPLAFVLYHCIVPFHCHCCPPPSLLPPPSLCHCIPPSFHPCCPHSFHFHRAPWPYPGHGWLQRRVQQLSLCHIDMCLPHNFLPVTACWQIPEEINNVGKVSYHRFPPPQPL